MTTLVFAAASFAVGMAAMYIPARLARYDAAVYNALAEDRLTKVEARDAAFEETRNRPWYWSTDPAAPAIEAAPAEHEGEVLHVEHPTQEMRLVDGLARLADEVGLVQALGCCTAHGDEPCAQDSGLVPAYCCDDCPDRMSALTAEPNITADDLSPIGPKDGWRAPWWSPLAIAVAVLLVGLLLPVWLAWLACEWLAGKAQSAAATWRRRRDERYLIGSGEQATAGDPFAELLTHATTDRTAGIRAVVAASGIELDIADEAELDEQRAEWVEVNEPYTGRRLLDVHADRDLNYLSRHVKPGFETGIFPQINAAIPAQRTGDEA